MLFDSEKWRTLTSIGVEDKKKEREKKIGLENSITHYTLWRFRENYFHSEIWLLLLRSLALVKTEIVHFISNIFSH